MSTWSCEFKRNACRNPQGCHCREIEGLAAKGQADAKELARLQSELDGQRRKLVAELHRDLGYVREMKTALRTMGWTKTVQFTSTEMRERALAAILKETTPAGAAPISK